MGKILQCRTAHQPQHRMLAGGVNRATEATHLRHPDAVLTNRPAALGARNTPESAPSSPRTSPAHWASITSAKSAVLQELCKGAGAQHAGIC